LDKPGVWIFCLYSRYIDDRLSGVDCGDYLEQFQGEFSHDRLFCQQQSVFSGSFSFSRYSPPGSVFSPRVGRILCLGAFLCLVSSFYMR